MYRRNLHAHSFFRKVMDFKGSLNHASNIAHDWDLIAYSVRWNGANSSAKSGQFSSDLEQLVEAYEHSYKPTSEENCQDAAVAKVKPLPNIRAVKCR